MFWKLKKSQRDVLTLNVMCYVVGCVSVYVYVNGQI